MADTLDLLSLAEGKAAVGITDAGTSLDTLLAQKITAVSRRFDRSFGPVVVRTYTDEVHPGGHDSIWVRHWPVSSFTTVTEYAATVSQALTSEDFDTQPTEGYFAERWHTPTANFSGRLYRRGGGARAVFPVGPEAVKVTYVAGRAANTAAVDPAFKDAASVMLKNTWRPHEAATQIMNEFDVPAQNFPRFGVPNYVIDMLAEEVVDHLVVA